jgi:SlyX protein
MLSHRQQTTHAKTTSEISMTTASDEAERQDRRISELESRLEFQDETIQKLNDEMVQLQHKLFAQEKQLKRLNERLQARGEDEDGADPNQIEPPPPHY